jgi:hypothetical protein
LLNNALFCPSKFYIDIPGSKAERYGLNEFLFTFSHIYSVGIQDVIHALITIIALDVWDASIAMIVAARLLSDLTYRKLIATPTAS